MTDSTASPDTSAALPAWRQDLAGALHRNRADAASRYLQLATVQPDGAPANRTLVFRGFDADSGALLLISDDRSAKPADLRAEPRAAIAWYFAKTREQFRLTGTVKLWQPEGSELAARLCATVWDQLSPAARAQYFWPAPGSEMGGASSDAAPIKPEQPPAWFLVLGMAVSSVDHLELRPTPQRRRRHRLEGGHWQVEAIHP